MLNHNIENLRNTLRDYPKLWEWESRFIQMPQDVRDIIPVASLTLLCDSAKLPGIIVGDVTTAYKGAIVHFGSRVDLQGTLSLNFKEVKGNEATESWLVRRAMNKWLEKVDSFAGDKVQVAEYKSVLEINMLDESGDSFYKVRYFGLKPTDVPELALDQEVKAEYPITTANFTYDYWRDQYDVNFGG